MPAYINPYNLWSKSDEGIQNVMTFVSPRSNHELMQNKNKYVGNQQSALLVRSALIMSIKSQKGFVMYLNARVA